jgi:hypothetical protein
MEFYSKTCRMELYSFSQNREVSDNIFVQNNVYRIKFILIILVVQLYVLKVI